MNFVAKLISRETYGGLYIANESTMHTDATYFDKVCVHVRGSKDVYYLNMNDGRMFVYRAKLERDVNGCLFVRNRDEYIAIYNLIAAQRYQSMPENFYEALDRKWNAQLESGMNG